MNRFLIAFLALFLALSGPALAAGKGKGKDKGATVGASSHQSGGQIDEGDIAKAVLVGAITALEREIIGDYIHSHDVSGLQSTLPPGIAKNYALGKPLPPGIAKKLPGGLLGQLPPRTHHQLLVVDHDIVLIEAATRVVVDILIDAL